VERLYYEQESLWGELGGVRSGPVLERIGATASAIPIEARSLLDVGAGDGLLGTILVERKPHLKVVSADRSLVALRHATTVRVASDVVRLPFLDRSFDVVAACEVLEHLPVGVFEEALREICRVAGRWLLITVPHDEDLKRVHIVCPACQCAFHPNYHVRSFTASALSDLFEGFRVREVREVGPPRIVYPRSLVRVAGRIRLIPSTPGHSCTNAKVLCPQCGWRPSGIGPSGSRSSAGRLAPRPTVRRLLGPLTPLVRQAVAIQRRPWLLALYERLDKVNHDG